MTKKQRLARDLERDLKSTTDFGKRLLTLGVMLFICGFVG